MRLWRRGRLWNIKTALRRPRTFCSFVLVVSLLCIFEVNTKEWVVWSEYSRIGLQQPTYHRWPSPDKWEICLLGNKCFHRIIRFLIWIEQNFDFSLRIFISLRRRKIKGRNIKDPLGTILNLSGFCENTRWILYFPILILFLLRIYFPVHNSL